MGLGTFLIEKKKKKTQILSVKQKIIQHLFLLDFDSLYFNSKNVIPRTQTGVYIGLFHT